MTLRASLAPRSFLSPYNKDDYAWTTVSKIRGIMSEIYEVGIIHQKTSTK